MEFCVHVEMHGYGSSSSVHFLLDVETLMVSVSFCNIISKYGR